ncbi:hypothetical protein EDD16DRAFT_1517242 [Pisolithus croceorrhizus]|nr:hypothetical protein EV401DRAFT_1887465 [Pisolithus croceorrhizus]KAI6125462.1 hypothetical protein EDD16DRAFT_1517242 [Pisolithus croceorrhizus]
MSSEVPYSGPQDQTFGPNHEIVSHEAGINSRRVANNHSIHELEFHIKPLRWELGSIHWKMLMDGEYNKLQKEWDGQIEHDKGTKQAHCSTGESSHSQAKTYKSAAIVDTDDDDNEDPVNNPKQASTPLDSATYPLHQGRWQGGINDNFVGIFLDGEGHMDDFMWPLDSMQF